MQFQSPRQDIRLFHEGPNSPFEDRRNLQPPRENPAVAFGGQRQMLVRAEWVESVAIFWTHCDKHITKRNGVESFALNFCGSNRRDAKRIFQSGTESQTRRQFENFRRRFSNSESDFNGNDLVFFSRFGHRHNKRRDTVRQRQIRVLQRDRRPCEIQHWRAHAQNE